MSSPVLHVVLLQPVIPQNTGSIGRLCLGTGARLHLVEPLGFDIDEKAVRRAGLDYWKDVDLRVHASTEALYEALDVPPERWCFFSARASRSYTDRAFERGDVLVFGKETAGLGGAVLAAAGERAYTIPLSGPIRSLNLAVATGIAVFEALRQLGLGPIQEQ